MQYLGKVRNRLIWITNYTYQIVPICIVLKCSKKVFNPLRPVMSVKYIFSQTDKVGFIQSRPVDL